MTSWDFPTTEPIDLRVSVAAGNIAVTAAATAIAAVTIAPRQPSRRGDDFVEATRVTFDDGKLSITEPHSMRRSRALDVTVNLPTGSSCRMDTASADMRCAGELRSLDVKTASGDLTAERVTGKVSFGSASGGVRLDDAGALEAQTASGDVRVATTAGDIKIQTASGDVRIGSVSRGDTDVQSASGHISVGVAAGVGVYLDVSTLSGTASSELETSAEDGKAEVTLRCRTLSGDVRVSRAAELPAR